MSVPVYFDHTLQLKKDTVADAKSTTIDQVKNKFIAIANHISYSDIENTIIYDGNTKSDIMLVGEAPGADEVIEKKPFVGRSGKLLQLMLDHVGLHRSFIYITNVMPWRPPMNRPPLPHEISVVRGILLDHIRMIDPKILFLIGGIAYKAVTDLNIPISKCRGKWFSMDLCPNIMATFHPSFLLRVPTNRKYVWHDMISLALLVRKMNLSHGDSCLKLG